MILSQVILKINRLAEQRLVAEFYLIQPGGRQQVYISFRIGRHVNDIVPV